MAKRDSLTAERVRELLCYDPATGVFTNRAPRQKIRVGERAGTTCTGRCVITIDYRHYFAAVLAWLYMTGAWPRHQVDHRDRDPLNDRWDNLRAATNKQNQENRSLDRRNKSGVKGVHWQKLRSKWCAQIRHNGETFHLGLFDDLESAAKARIRAESEMFTHGVSISVNTTR